MRADLLALTPELLARLANVGLVKRAQKEALPAIAEDDDTVIATSKDGATTRLPKGAPLDATTCTCGAPMCRHRIAAVLAYQQLHGAATVEAWDPGALDETGCGEAAVLRADQLQAHGVVATVRDYTVVLPTATVQFLVPRDLAYAKCDCARGNLCEHVVLAIRAVRAGQGTVTLGGGTTVDTAAVLAAMDHLARHGLSAPGSDARLAQARAGAERARWWWIADGLEELERLAEAYASQSASFSLARLAREGGELVARLRAAAGGALAPAWILGSDRVGETAMEQTRLLALGVHFTADGERRLARMYFADPDTSTVLVLDKLWPSEPRVGHELGALYGSSKLTVADLARGELLTRNARRKANGALDLGAARGMKASLLPSTSSWAQLSAPLLVSDLAAHGARLDALPPVCLRPRGRGAQTSVVALKRVAAIDAPTDGQSVTAVVEDLAGNPLALRVEHRAVSPGAVDATLAALREGPSHVAGELVHGADGWAMAPLAFLGSSLVAIELARPSRHVAEPGLPRARQEPALATALRDYVGRMLLTGVRATTAIARQLARDAEASGAGRIAALCTRAGDGDATAALDLAVLHQLDER